jgi:hypothetical protein
LDKVEERRGEGGVDASRDGRRGTAGGIPGLSIQSRIFFSSPARPRSARTGPVLTLAWTRLLVPVTGTGRWSPSTQYSPIPLNARREESLVQLDPPFGLVYPAVECLEPTHLPLPCLASARHPSESRRSSSVPWDLVSEAFSNQLIHGGDDNAVVSWLGTRLHRQASRLGSA